jgi:hypothetical protein
MSHHKTFLFVLILASVPALHARKATTTVDPEQAGVLRTVQTLLDGWREADASKLQAALHPDFREVTLHLQNGKWNFATESRDRLIKTTARIEKGAWDDRLLDPVVHVDGMIAVVWSHYKFTVRYTEKGVAHSPSHCGVETFQLYRTNSGWKIVNFADTHADACP